MKSNMCSVAKEAPADELGSHMKAQNGHSINCEVKNMAEKEQALVAVTGDIIEMETDNGMLVIDNIMGHTYGFLGHKNPVLTAIDGMSAFGLKKTLEAHNNGDGVWQGYMDDKVLFRQMVRLGIIYQNAGRWHINQQMVEFVGEEIIQEWNSHNIQCTYTETGDSKHALNKLRFLVRKRKEWEQNKKFEPPKQGTYFWYKQNIVSAELVEIPILPITREMIRQIFTAKRTPKFMKEPLEDESIFKCRMKTDETEYITVYRGALYSKKKSDYVWTAQLLKKLSKKKPGHKPENKHDTMGQLDCYGNPVNRFAWQPSRQEVFTEITGADLLNEKIRNSRNSTGAFDEAVDSKEDDNNPLDMKETREVQKRLRKDRNVPVVTDEERDARQEDNRRARDNLYRYKQKQAQKAQDDRDELQRTYDEAFDRLGYGK